MISVRSSNGYDVSITIDDVHLYWALYSAFYYGHMLEKQQFEESRTFSWFDSSLAYDSLTDTFYSYIDHPDIQKFLLKPPTAGMVHLGRYLPSPVPDATKLPDNLHERLVPKHRL